MGPSNYLTPDPGSRDGYFTHGLCMCGLTSGILGKDSCRVGEPKASKAPGFPNLDLLL